MSDFDHIVEECLRAYRDGDYLRCADAARELLDQRVAPFVVSQLLVISLQRSGRDEDALTAGRWMVNALGGRPWLKSLVQVTLGQEPPDLRPADDLARCQLLYYRGARCRTLGEDDRALDLFDSAARIDVNAPERDLARHEANELAIVVDGESGAQRPPPYDDEDDRETSQAPVPPGARGRSYGPVPTVPPPPMRTVPPPAPAAPSWTPPPVGRVPPVRSTPAPAPARGPSLPPRAAPAPSAPPRVPTMPDLAGPAATAPHARPTGASAPRLEMVRRHATVRYWRQMAPNKLHPMLVVLSAEQIATLAQAALDQAATDAVEVLAEEPVVIEPMLPGCLVYPPHHEVRIGTDEITQARFQVLPVVASGRLDGATVIFRQGGVRIAEVALRARVRRSTAAWALAGASLVVPPLLQAFKLDLKTQIDASFGGYAALAGQALAQPWWAWSLGLVGLAAVAAAWTWPRRQTFWNVELVRTRTVR